MSEWPSLFELVDFCPEEIVKDSTYLIDLTHTSLSSFFQFNFLSQIPFGFSHRIHHKFQLFYSSSCSFEWVFFLMMQCNPWEENFFSFNSWHVCILPSTQHATNKSILCAHTKQWLHGTVVKWDKIIYTYMYTLTHSLFWFMCNIWVYICM